MKRELSHEEKIYLACYGTAAMAIQQDGENSTRMMIRHYNQQGSWKGINNAFIDARLDAFGC